MANGNYALPGMEQARGDPGPLVSLVDAIQGFRNRGRVREDARTFVQLGAQRLRQIGTPESEKLAAVFEQNPIGVMNHAKQFYGGMPQLEAMLMQHKAATAFGAVSPEMALLTEQIGPKAASETLKNVRTAYEPYKRPVMKGAGDLLYYTDTGEVVPGQEEAPYKPQTQVEKLQEAIRQAKARGDEQGVQELENALLKAQFGTGMELQFTPGGGFRYETGIQRGKQDLTPAMTSKIQTDVYNYTNRLDRLHAIEDAFNPKFHKIGAKIWGAGLELYEKMLKGEETLTGEEQKFIEDLTRYRTAAYTEMNSLLRELSGAAVNPQEAERLLEQIVDVGKHWWQGDAPTKAREKYETAIAMVSRMKARSVYMLQHPKDVSAGNYTLDRIYDLIIDRASEEIDSLKKQFPDIGDDALRARVNGVIVQEFGVTVNDVMERRNAQ